MHMTEADEAEARRRWDHLQAKHSFRTLQCPKCGGLGCGRCDYCGFVFTPPSPDGPCDEAGCWLRERLS